MNVALWFVFGGLIAGINSTLQKWSVDRMQPDLIKDFSNASRFRVYS